MVTFKKIIILTLSSQIHAGFFDNFRKRAFELTFDESKESFGETCVSKKCNLEEFLQFTRVSFGLSNNFMYRKIFT